MHHYSIGTLLEAQGNTISATLEIKQGLLMVKLFWLESCTERGTGVYLFLSPALVSLALTPVV